MFGQFRCSPLETDPPKPSIRSFPHVGRQRAGYAYNKKRYEQHSASTQPHLIVPHRIGSDVLHGEFPTDETSRQAPHCRTTTLRRLEPALHRHFIGKRVGISENEAALFSDCLPFGANPPFELFEFTSQDQKRFMQLVYGTFGNRYRKSIHKLIIDCIFSLFYHIFR